MQTDPKEINDIKRLTAGEFDEDQLAGFLRSRSKYMNNAMRECGALQFSKSTIG